MFVRPDSRSSWAFRLVAAFLTGIVLGHLCVRLLQILGVSKYTDLKGAVALAVQQVDRKFGDKTFLYGVRGIAVNEVSGTYDFEMEISVGAEKRVTLVSAVPVKHVVIIKFLDVKASSDVNMTSGNQSCTSVLRP